MILTNEERKKFIEYLEQTISSSEAISTQLKVMNKTEKLIYKLIKLTKENKLENYYKRTPREIIEKDRLLFQKVMSLKPESTEKLKELCKKSTRKDITEIIDKKYLSEEERVHLAIYIVSHY